MYIYIYIYICFIIITSRLLGAAAGARFAISVFVRCLGHILSLGVDISLSLLLLFSLLLGVYIHIHPIIILYIRNPMFRFLLVSYCCVCSDYILLLVL